MDRMVLERKSDADGALAPIEHGRMKASYWMEKIHSQELSSVESVIISKNRPIFSQLLLVLVTGAVFHARHLTDVGMEPRSGRFYTSTSKLPNPCICSMSTLRRTA